MSPPPPLADPVDPTRVRTLPRHFAWIDHRLRDRLRELSLEEIALLVFLHLRSSSFCTWPPTSTASASGLTPPSPASST